MSAFGPPSPVVDESLSKLPESEHQIARELHPDYEGRRLNAQAAAAAAAAEAAVAAATAAQAAASAHTAAAAEQAAEAATQAAALATAAAALATADAISVSSVPRGNSHTLSLPRVELLPPSDNIASPRVAPWLLEARSSVKDLAASPSQHRQFLEFTKEPGLADEYLPSPAHPSRSTAEFQRTEMKT
jgi:pyruvate/2-oxoglutarate dehydrogenase complex dihydrolipoamide acyltransferase (E2) component